MTDSLRALVVRVAEGSPSAGETAAADRLLVSRVRLGDTAAFEELFRAHYAMVYDFALRYVRVHADAEEVAQDVFAVLWARRAEWDVRGTIRAYLFGAARNQALTLLRRLRVRGDVGGAEPLAAEDIGEIPGMGVAPVTADRHVLRAEAAEVVRRAVAALPKRRREVLALRWEYGLGHAETAEILGISERAVEQTHRRTMQDLRAALTKRP